MHNYNSLPYSILNSDIVTLLFRSYGVELIIIYVIFLLLLFNFCKYTWYVMLLYYVLDCWLVVILKCDYNNITHTANGCTMATECHKFKWQINGLIGISVTRLVLCPKPTILLFPIHHINFLIAHYIQPFISFELRRVIKITRRTRTSALTRVIIIINIDIPFFDLYPFPARTT